MRYLKLFFASWKYCFIRIMEFRAEVISWSINSVSWAIISLIIMNVIYTQVDSIAGWTKREAMILSATGSMFNSFLWLFVIPSLLNLGDMIRKGDFDFYLLKPVNSQFLSSISRFEFDQYLRIVAMIWFLVSVVPNTSGLVGYLILLGAGLVAMYSLFSMITTLCFWIVGSEGMDNLFDSIVTMGRYPTNIFEGGMRVVFFFIIPMAFVATFPVQVLLGKAGWNLVGVGVLTATIFLLLSHFFWDFALKRYSSASS